MSNTSDQTTKPSKKTRLIIGEVGVDTETGIVGKGHSYDNGKTFTVDDTIYGRIYHDDDHGKIWQGIQDKVKTVVEPAKSAADSAVAYANDAIEKSRVNSQAIDDINSAVSDTKQGANDAMIRAKSAWDVATGAKEAVTDFDPLLKNAQSDASMALTQIADTANALSDAKTAFTSDVAEAKNLASTAQTTADNAVKSASSVANDLTAVASQAKANADGITKVTSDVGTLQTTVADNSGNISTIQATAKQIQQAVSDNAGNITVAKQTADSAATVASDARSNATVAIQTASQASITAKNASGQAASAVITANGAMTTASNAKGDATVAVQIASGASLTAINANSDATVAKQTASEAKVQASNAESDFAQLSIRAGQIEANVANNSGAIASVQQTANGLTTTVSNIKANGGGVNLLVGTSTASGDVANGNGTLVKGAFNGYDAVKTNGAWSERFIDLKSALGRMNAKAGDWYTISVYAKADKQINGGSLVVCRALGEVDANTNDGFLDAIPMQNKPITTQWQQYSWSFQVNDISLQRQITRVEYDQDTGDNWIYWAGWMLEKGVVTHDWSPAIDDFQNQFTQVKASIDGINTTINDPKTGLNATYQTASGNATTISNVKSDVYQLETTANGLTSRVGNLESKTDTQETAIEQNKEAITLKADQTDVDTLKGNVTSLQAEVTTQANEITTKVTQSDVTGMLTGYATQDYTQSLVTQKANDWNLNLTSLKTDVDAIKANGGGVNLLTGTSKDELSGKAYWFHDYQISGGLQPGTTYTLSGWARVDQTAMDNQQHIFVYAYTSNWSWGGALNIDGSLTAKYNTETFTTPSGEQQFNPTVSVYLSHPNGDDSKDSISGTGYISKLMLEKGTVAHDWSPAPNDMATVTSVTNLSATVDGIQAQVYNSDGSSKITQLSNVIQSKIGDAQTSISDLKDKTLWKDTDSADLNEVVSQQKLFVKDGSNLPPGSYWWYVQVEPGYSGRVAQYAVSDRDNKHFSRQYDGANWSAWVQDASESEITQLRDDINLRVTKGDLISQINLQAGTALIQSNKLVLDAETTVFTGNAFIPSAAIAELDADKLTFYGNGAKASMGASIAQYDDDKAKSTINLQYDGGIEIHSSSQQGSILTMHDNTIRLASKSWGDNSNPYQYSGFYAAPNYSLMNTYHRDGTTSGVAIDDNRIWIYGNSKDQQLGALQADVGWYSINGKTGSLTGGQISLKAGNTQVALTDRNINIENTINTNSNNYDVAIHIKGWAEMTGWFSCMGITQTSLLSTKTRIEPLDTKSALDKIVSANVETYQFKSDVANGKTKRHASVIIDDVNDVAEYYTPEEFISEDRKGRDDGDIIGYLMGAVQELKKQLDELKEKIYL